MPDYLLLFEEGEKEEQSSAVEATCRKLSYREEEMTLSMRLQYNNSTLQLLMKGHAQGSRE